MVSKKKQILLIVLCWAVYTIAYIGRYSYTSNVVPILKFYGVSKEEFSLATTFFFFTYGAGQIINGILCRRYNMRYMIFGALILSSVINFSVFLNIPFYLIKFLWIINGVCQSVLWASLLRILSCYLDDKNMNLAVLFMSTTVSLGTFMSYGSSALFALFDGFKYAFLLAAVVMTAVAVVWVAFYGTLTENQRLENAKTSLKDTNDGGKVSEEKEYDPDAIKKNANKNGLLRGMIMLIVLFGGYAIAINFIKDGLTTWLPQILSEKYELPDSLSIILTLVLPVFAVFGAVAAVFVNKIIRNYSDINGVFFAISGACMLGIGALLKTELWYIALALFGIVNMLMHGANNVVTSMLPLAIGKKYNAGLVGGVLNGSCYIGSTLSTYLMALIATESGWNAVIDLLFIVCVVLVAFAFLMFVVRKIRRGDGNVW